MRKANPIVGFHPELLPRKHQYPTAEETARADWEGVGEDVRGHEAAMRREAQQRGESPVFVPLSELTEEQIHGMKRSQFTNEEWDSMYVEDCEVIEERDEESQSRVDELAEKFINRWKWAHEEHDRSADEYLEYGFEEWIRYKGDDLYDEMPSREYDAVIEYAQELGVDEQQAREKINEVMQDTNNYRFGWSDDRRGESAIYSENEINSIYMDFDEWEEELKVCYPDEVDRAVTKINNETQLDISKKDIVPKPGKRYHTYEVNDIETGSTAYALVNWSGMADMARDLIAEIEIPDDQDKPDALAPEDRVVYKWADGFYVQDLLPSELAAEGKTMGMCVGRPDMGYGKAVRQGEIKILSLRRPSGKPLFTIEAILKQGAQNADEFPDAEDDDIVGLDQIKGKANRKPGWDLGKDTIPYKQLVDDVQTKEILAALKKDEVKRVLEYVLHLDIKPLDVDDLVPAMFAIAHLRRMGDKWALQVSEGVPGFEKIETEEKQHALEGEAERAARLEAERLEAEEARLEVDQGPRWECQAEDGYGRRQANFYVRAHSVHEAREKAERQHPTWRIVQVSNAPRANPSSCEHGPSCTGFCRPYRSKRVKPNPFGRKYKFVGTDEALDAIREAEPSYDYVREIDEDRWDEDDHHHVRKVTWVGTAGYVVRIPAKNVLFMEGNQWFPSHGAALVEGIENGTRTTLQVPAARVYRVDSSRVKESQKYEKAGELEYQLSMNEPWTKDEQGEYYAQLLDGNHRAAAALIAGEPYIYVYVGENYRENVRKKDYE